eukprot:gene9176-9342_t
MQPRVMGTAASPNVCVPACYSSAVVVRRRVILANVGSGASRIKIDDSGYVARAPAAATATEAATTNAGGSLLPPQESTAVDPAPNQRSGPEFNWYKQWYPVAIVDQLDPAVPNPVQLLGMDLVLWRDKTQQWRAFKDCCPHRLAPLSEGRIDDRTGNLFCNYHGWQFDSTGSCANIPQLPAGAKAPSPARSPGAVEEALATPAAQLAPEIAQFGREAYWSSKLFLAGQTALGFWYQRGELTRDKAQPGEVQEFHIDSKGYLIKRNFAGEPSFGGGIGYVTPTTKGKCNMLLAIVRDPQYAAKPQAWWQKLLAPLLPPQPEWLNHISLHDVVDADVAMQHGLDVNLCVTNDNSREPKKGYMPAIGMDQGPIAFTRWLQKYGGGGPPTANEEEWRRGEQLSCLT